MMILKNINQLNNILVSKMMNFNQFAMNYMMKENNRHQLNEYTQDKKLHPMSRLFPSFLNSSNIPNLSNTKI